MTRFLLILMFSLISSGCGSDPAQEVSSYAWSVTKFKDHNRQIQHYIDLLDKSPQNATKEDLEEVRELIKIYAQEVYAILSPEDKELRSIHSIYKISFGNVRGNLQDRSGDLSQEVHNTSRALTQLRRDIKERVYPPLKDLVERHKLKAKYILSWPE